MKAILFSLCLLLSLPVWSQKKSLPASAERYALQIDAQRQQNSLIAKSLDHMSATGGSVTGFYAGEKLVLIYTVYSAERGYHAFNYYLRHDSLLLVRELQAMWKLHSEEDYERFDTYRIAHTDSSGVTDLSGWPMDIDDDNHYYFQDTVMVKAELKSFKKPQMAEKSELAEKNKDLLRRLRIHCGELEYRRK